MFIEKFAIFLLQLWLIFISDRVLHRGNSILYCLKPTVVDPVIRYISLQRRCKTAVKGSNPCRANETNTFNRFLSEKVEFKIDSH